MSDPVAAARRWIGTPYLHQGRIPGLALDCIGLVCVIARELGMEPEDNATYRPIPDGDTLVAGLDRHLIKRPIKEYAQPGDVLLFAFHRHPQHVAVLTPDGTIVHAYQSAGRVVENALNDTWKRLWVASYTWPAGFIAGCKTPYLQEISI